MKQEVSSIIFQDFEKEEVIAFKQRILLASVLFLFLFLTQLPTSARADSRESLKYPSPSMKKKPSISYSLETLWTKEFDSRLVSAPVIAQNQIIVLQPSGKLESFALNNGLLEWEKGPFQGGILLGTGEQAVLLKSASDLIALNASNGETQWITPLPSPIKEWSRVNANSFALLMDQNLYRLNLSDGSLIEIGPVRLSLENSSPFTFDGERYLAIVQYSKFVHLYDMKKGKVKWSFQSGTKITQPPVLKGKRIYVLSEDHFIYALKLRNGHQKYRKRMENKLKHPAALSEASLILSPFASNHLYQVEMSSGASQTLFSLDAERYHFVDTPSFTGDYLAATYADFFSESFFLVVFAVEKKQEEER
jgi:outer membrane protein assembly factor BamB